MIFAIGIPITALAVSMLRTAYIMNRDVGVLDQEGVFSLLIGVAFLIAGIAMFVNLVGQITGL